MTEAPILSRHCSKCDTIKSLTAFNKQANGPYGRKTICRVCHKLYYRLLAQERNRAAWKRPVEGVKRCPRCGQTRPVGHFGTARERADGLQARCKVCVNALRKKARTKLRLEIIAYYSRGEMDCSCCGESEIAFLQLDHCNGGGRKHRVSVGLEGKGSESFYRWLKDEGFPSGYRILCANCNSSLGFFGYCPHERERLTRAQDGLDQE